MKLILIALVLTILYQISTKAVALSREDHEPTVEKEKKPIFRIGRTPRRDEKDVTHRSRILDDESRKDR